MRQTNQITILRKKNGNDSPTSWIELYQSVGYRSRTSSDDYNRLKLIWFT